MVHFSAADGGIPLPDVVDPAGGANQTRVRAHNERLVMSLVRRHGGLSKAEIARRSGLSAQTVSVIMRGLEGDDLLIRGEPVRGRVGQPSVPMMLNPDAVYSFGVKIGRRSADLVLMDFVGTIRLNLHQPYPYPDPDAILAFILDGIGKIERMLDAAAAGAHRRHRHCHALRAVELGGGGGGAGGGHGNAGAPSTCRRSLPPAPAIRSMCRTMRPAPAARSWSSASAPAIRISSISTSAPSSAAASCSTRRCFPGVPERRARSGPCRFRVQMAARRRSSRSPRSSFWRTC